MGTMITGMNETSRKKLLTCHRDLIEVVSVVAVQFPLLVVCGERGQIDQDRHFKAGTSKVRFPNSKHNRTPSDAVDLAPLPLNWDDVDKFKVLAGAVLFVARSKGIKLKWGGDWGWDWGHFERDAEA